MGWKTTKNRSHSVKDDNQEHPWHGVLSDTRDKDNLNQEKMAVAADTLQEINDLEIDPLTKIWLKGVMPAGSQNSLTIKNLEDKNGKELIIEGHDEASLLKLLKTSVKLTVGELKEEISEDDNKKTQNLGNGPITEIWLKGSMPESMEKPLTVKNAKEPLEEHDKNIRREFMSSSVNLHIYEEKDENLQEVTKKEVNEPLSQIWLRGAIPNSMEGKNEKEYKEEKLDRLLLYDLMSSSAKVWTEKYTNVDTNIQETNHTNIIEDSTVDTGESVKNDDFYNSDKIWLRKVMSSAEDIQESNDDTTAKEMIYTEYNLTNNLTGEPYESLTKNDLKENLSSTTEQPFEVKILGFITPNDQDSDIVQETTVKDVTYKNQIDVTTDELKIKTTAVTYAKKPLVLNV